MKRLVLIGLLAASPAMAQQPDITPQLDTALSTVTTIVSNMRQQIIMDLQRLAQMQQQLVAVTAERDKLKADAEKKPELAKTP